MTTSKHALITLFFNLFSANQNVDHETKMVALTAVMAANWITWKNGGKENFIVKTSATEGTYIQKRYLFSVLAIASMDFALFELKKKNNTLKPEEIF